MLATLQKQFFPNTEVVLVNLTSGEEAKMNDIMDLMMLMASRGQQIEFITTLDEGAFEELRTIISLLSYSRLQDGRFYTSFHFSDPLPYFAECNGQPQLLIEKLRKDLNAEGRDVIFSDTLPPDAPAAVAALSVRCVTSMLSDIPDEVNRRLLSMVESVSRARVSKDTTQVEARFQDLRAYCDGQMRVHKSAFLPLALASASSDMNQKIGFLEQAVVVSQQTGEEICGLLFMEGAALLSQGRLDDARRWLVEARDTATASGVEIFATTATELLDDINRAQHPS